MNPKLWTLEDSWAGDEPYRKAATYTEQKHRADVASSGIRTHDPSVLVCDSKEHVLQFTNVTFHVKLFTQVSYPISVASVLVLASELSTERLFSCSVCLQQAPIRSTGVMTFPAEGLRRN
jgi:hypothetical protein